MPRLRRAGIAAALAALPVAAAYRFALLYRVRAGYPKRHPPAWTPATLGMRWEETTVASPDGLRRPAWFLPAGPEPAPAVVIVHGWESSRDRMLPHAQVLHAAGLHVLVFDVRAHGENGPDSLPISVAEFGDDARAAVRTARDRADVTGVAVMGHSMGAAGALLAAAADDPRVDAVVAIAAPADPYRLTRQTFRLAKLPIPEPVAWPLAWLTTRVYLRPRGHAVRSVSAADAIRRIEAPVLLVHGEADAVVPVGHLARLAAIRRRARPALVTETLVVEGGHHSWLYEFAEFRSGVAAFLATHLDGPVPPAEAAARAAMTVVGRLPDPERITVLAEEPGGVRSLGRLLRRIPRPDTHEGAPAGLESIADDLATTGPGVASRPEPATAAGTPRP